jgi:hypothetical protein
MPRILWLTAILVLSAVAAGAWLAKNLPDVNSALSAKQLHAVHAIGRADWEKQE